MQTFPISIEEACGPGPARLGEIEHEEWVEITIGAGAVQAATSPPTTYLPDE